MSKLRSRAIRLAKERPDLRDILLPVLAAKDEKEGKFEEGEDVPLSELPAEVAENAKNPPEKVRKLKEEMKEKGKSAALKIPADVLAKAKKLGEKAYAAGKKAPALDAALSALWKPFAAESKMGDMIPVLKAWQKGYTQAHLSDPKLLAELAKIEKDMQRDMQKGKQKGKSAAKDEKEGKFSEGEDVPLSKLPKEVRENVTNPPPSVQKVKKKIQEKNKSASEAVLFAATVKLAKERPDLRGILLPILAAKDEKEGKFSEGEDVPLEKLPKEVRENVTNPPPSVQKVKKKIQEKNKSASEDALFDATIKLASEYPELQADLIPMLAEYRKQAAAGDDGKGVTKTKHGQLTIETHWAKGGMYASKILALSGKGSLPGGSGKTRQESVAKTKALLSGKKAAKDSKETILRRIVKEHQAEKIDGQMVDGVSASLAVKALDSLDKSGRKAAKEKFLKMDIGLMMSILWATRKTAAAKKDDDSELPGDDAKKEKENEEVNEMGWKPGQPKTKKAKRPRT